MSNPFAGTLAVTAGLAVAFSVDYYWFDTKPNVELVRFAIMFLGCCLLIDIYRFFTQK